MTARRPTLPPVFGATEALDNTACLVTRDLRIVTTNEAWRAYARDNGGDPAHASTAEGASLLDAIAPPLRPFYERGFAAVSATGTPWEHDYHCNSPDAFRVFRMTVYPHGDYLTITHAQVVERAPTEVAHDPTEAYRHRGLITMCCCCRRIRNPGTTRWDWVPAWVAQAPPGVSHGLCPPCLEYHYPPEEPPPREG